MTYRADPAGSLGRRTHLELERGAIRVSDVRRAAFAVRRTELQGSRSGGLPFMRKRLAGRPAASIR